MKYLLDSNIIIYHLNGNKTATDFITKNMNICAVSRISYVEVMSFDFTDDEFAKVKDFMDCFSVLDTNRNIAVQCLENRKI